MISVHPVGCTQGTYSSGVIWIWMSVINQLSHWHDWECHLRDTSQNPGLRQQRTHQGVTSKNNSFRYFFHKGSISLEPSGFKRNIHVTCLRIFFKVQGLWRKRKKGPGGQNAIFKVKEWGTEHSQCKFAAPLVNFMGADWVFSSFCKIGWSFLGKYLE